MKKPLISVHIWTERFLGSEEKGRSFLSLIKRLEDGRWTPDKWGQFEPVRNAFTNESEDRMLDDWSEERQGRVSNSMYFTKKKPALFLGATSWKGRVPDLNYVWFDMEAREFSGPEGVARLKGIVAEFVEWSGAAYATAWGSGQHHNRSAPGNPMTRLDQLNWLTFLGASYLRLLGKEQVQSCPFYSCEPLADGLLLTAAERPDSPTMIESDHVLLNLEECLGADVFASDEYPEVPCRVPNFNLEDTVNASPNGAA